MKTNNWQAIWNSREDRLDEIDLSDKKKVFLELKRIDGFDVNDGGIPYEGLMEQYQDIKARLGLQAGNTLFEIGCGAGANLYLFHNDGIKVGGLDYSSKLIEIMQKVFSKEEWIECICGEAVECPFDIQYDAVLSNSVFSYFPNYEYAERVLYRCIQKSCHSIAIIDIHDEEKENDFLKYRIRYTENYEERYKNLPKLFYSKKFFEDFAKRHGWEIRFADSMVTGYWNNPFVFNCYMYKE